MNNFPIDLLQSQANQTADDLAKVLQPAEIAVYIGALIERSTQIIRAGCDHGCSLAFLALLSSGVDDTFAEELEIVPAASVSPEIHALIDQILGTEDEED